MDHHARPMPSYLKERPKQRVKKELENEKIWYENQILLNKLTKIDKRVGKLNPYFLQTKYFKPSLTHNGIINKEHLKKVKKENKVRRLKFAGEDSPLSSKQLQSWFELFGDFCVSDLV